MKIDESIWLVYSGAEKVVGSWINQMTKTIFSGSETVTSRSRFQNTIVSRIAAMPQDTAI